MTAIEALKKGLLDLVDLCNVVMDKFKVEGEIFGKQADNEDADGADP